MRRYLPAFWCSLCMIVTFAAFLPASGCSVDKTGLSMPPGRAPAVSAGVAGGSGVAAGTGGGTGIPASGTGGGTVGSGGSGTTGTGGTGTGGAAAGTGGAPPGSGGSGGAASATGGSGTGGTAGTGGAPGGRGGVSGAGGSVGAGGALPGGSGGASPVPISTVGCSDGTREAFANAIRFPTIAGCAGGWSVPGVLTPASMTPACARAAGNSGLRPNGGGCTVEDLCAIGWHACLGDAELTDLGFSCDNAGISTSNNAVPQFFVSRQRGIQATACISGDNAAMDVNNLHGCGTFGLDEDPNCASLDSQLSHTECDDNPPWSCSDPNSVTDEALVVVKPGSAAGGVLCCRSVP